jgi:hypothetical protein
VRYDASQEVTVNKGLALVALAAIAGFITLGASLGAGLAHADKTFNKGKGASWDCGKDPSVVINHGRGNYKLTGACKTISVTGGENQLTIDTVDTLTIVGASNTIAIGTADSITVTGSGNKITYKTAKSGKVQTTTVGTGNSVDQAK